MKRRPIALDYATPAPRRHSRLWWLLRLPLALALTLIGAWCIWTGVGSAITESFEYVTLAYLALATSGIFVCFGAIIAIRAPISRQGQTPAEQLAIQITLTLPNEMAAILQTRATESGHPDVEAYVEDLLRDHIQVLDLGCPPGILSEDDPRLEAELERGLNDPAPLIEATPAFWKELKDGARHRRESRQS